MTKDEIWKQIEEIQVGCDKKIDTMGFCAYYSSKGNLRLCGVCKRKIDKLKLLLK